MLRDWLKDCIWGTTMCLASSCLQGLLPIVWMFWRKKNWERRFRQEKRGGGKVSCCMRWTFLKYQCPQGSSLWRLESSWHVGLLHSKQHPLWHIAFCVYLCLLVCILMSLVNCTSDTHWTLNPLQCEILGSDMHCLAGYPGNGTSMSVYVCVYLVFFFWIFL